MRETNKRIIRPAHLVLLIVLVTALVVACGGSSPPPGPDKALGSVTQGGYLFLRWQEGLQVMIWHDLAGEGTADSAGFASGRLYIERGAARSAGGRSLAWEVQTRDGTTGEVDLGGTGYSLEAGNLFLVSTRGDTMAVRQLHRDLSAVPVDHESILAFARSDPDLAAFLQEAPVVTPSPTVPATATDAPAVDPSPAGLSATLEAPSALPNGESVAVTFTLTNHSPEQLYVLTWYTPLEGIYGEIFRVARDGQPIPYKGPLVMRGDPLPEDYVPLDPGASVSAEVDLATVYDFSQAGEYTIGFLSPKISHVAKSEDEFATSVHNLGPVEIPSNSVSVRIEGSSNVRDRVFEVTGSE